MKIGSLVECIVEIRGQIYNEKFPAVGILYTVRDIEDFKEDGIGIRLEEVVNEDFEYMIHGRMKREECLFDINCFREVQEPIEININSLEMEVA